MKNKKKTIPGFVTRNKRYMKRHPEEEKIVPVSARRNQLQANFQDLTQKK